MVATPPRSLVVREKDLALMFDPRAQMHALLTVDPEPVLSSGDEFWPGFADTLIVRAERN
jgi:hypothetical protein